MGLRHPVTPATRPLPPRGHIITRSGTFAGGGPALTPLKTRVRARQPLPLRGTVITRTGAISGTGPPIPPRAQPVRAVLFRLPSGRAITLRIVQVAAAPVTGPQLYPLHAPVPASLPAPRQHGHAEGLTGTYSGQGPALAPRAVPIRARQPLPPRAALRRLPCPVAVPAPPGPRFRRCPARRYPGPVHPHRACPVVTAPLAPFLPAPGQLSRPKRSRGGPRSRRLSAADRRSRTGCSLARARQSSHWPGRAASLPLQPVPAGRAATMSLLVVTLPASAAAPAPRGAPRSVRSCPHRLSPQGYMRAPAGTYTGEGPAVRPLAGRLQARRPPAHRRDGALAPPPGRLLPAKARCVRPLAGPGASGPSDPPAPGTRPQRSPAPWRYRAHPPFLPAPLSTRCPSPSGGGCRLPAPPGRAATMTILAFTLLATQPRTADSAPRPAVADGHPGTAPGRVHPHPPWRLQWYRPGG